MSAPRPDGPPIRVAVIDDHELFRSGVVSAIEQAVDVVGQADDIDSGVAMLRAVQPRVVLLDVHLTSGSGAAIIDMVRADLPEVAFLALSVSDSPEDVLGLVRAGARGYVTKRIGGDELVASIEQVAAGNAVFSPRLAGFVLDAFAATGATAGATTSASASGVGATHAASDRPVDVGPDPGAGVDRLTGREREVMQHLARGYAYKEIAAALCISVRTVESHASAVLRKLQLSSRAELAHWANRHRIV